MNKVAAKGAFSLSRKCIHPFMPQYKWICKEQRNSTGQGEGLTNEGRHWLLLVHKQVHDKEGIAKSLQVYINRAKLCVRWVYF